MGLSGKTSWPFGVFLKRSDRVSIIVCAFAATLVLAAIALVVVTFLATDQSDAEPLRATVEAVAAESTAVTDEFFRSAETVGSLVERVLDGDPSAANVELRRVMQLVVAEYDAVNGVFVGYGNGDFVYVTTGLATEPDGLRMKLITDADLDSRLVRELQLDHTFQLTSETTQADDEYDPRMRLWYEGAKGEPLGWTDPYVFASSGEPGITHFRRHESFDQIGTVLGVDMRLQEITDFLSDRQPGDNGIAAVFSSTGAVIAGANAATDATIDVDTSETVRSGSMKTIVSDEGRAAERNVVTYSGIGDREAWTLVVGAQESDYAATLSDQVDRTRTIILLAAVAFSGLVLLLAGAALSRVKRLRRKATIDDETGLATRAEAHAAVGAILKSGRPILLVTSTVGRGDHDGGAGFESRVLREIGHALQTFATVDGLAGRTGTRDFLVARPLSAADHPVSLVSNLHHELSAVIARDAASGPSVIGWNVLEPVAQSRTIEGVLRNLDLALLTAEAGSNPVVEYSQDLQPPVVADERMRRDLTDAIESESFEMHFQPEIDLNSGELVGAEALMRRRMPDGEVESALLFIEDLERLGLLHKLTHMVLDQAVDFALRWRALQSFTIRINLAASELNDPGVVARLAGLTDMTAHDWCIELTERTIESLSPEAVEQLEDLARSGVGIALDDFGTGYSSMAELKRLPITALKIDRSFVEPLVTAPGEPVSIAALIQSVAARLGLDLVAEGVETDTQRRALVDLGCERGQGWFVSPALSANDFVTWAQDHATAPQPLNEAS